MTELKNLLQLVNKGADLALNKTNTHYTTRIAPGDPSSLNIPKVLLDIDLNGGLHLQIIIPRLGVFNDSDGYEHHLNPNNPNLYANIIRRRVTAALHNHYLAS